jgi:hypothetical protein
MTSFTPLLLLHWTTELLNYQVRLFKIQSSPICSPHVVTSDGLQQYAAMFRKVINTDLASHAQLGTHTM